MSEETERAVREAWSRVRHTCTYECADFCDENAADLDAAIRADERAKVVAWLREKATAGVHCQGCWLSVADVIERGAHNGGENG